MMVTDYTTNKTRIVPDNYQPIAARQDADSSAAKDAEGKVKPILKLNSPNGPDVFSNDSEFQTIGVTSTMNAFNR